jgi:hypothetical protein
MLQNERLVSIYSAHVKPHPVKKQTPGVVFAAPDHPGNHGWGYFGHTMRVAHKKQRP